MGVRILIGGAKGIGLRTVVPLVPLLILLVGMAIAEASFASSPTIRDRPQPCPAACPGIRFSEDMTTIVDFSLGDRGAGVAG